eukprot:6483193-Amphidinium_carterae.4
MSATGHETRPQDAHEASVKLETKNFGPPRPPPPCEARQQTVREVRVQQGLYAWPGTSVALLYHTKSTDNPLSVADNPDCFLLRRARRAIV